MTIRTIYWRLFVAAGVMLVAGLGRVAGQSPVPSAPQAMRDHFDAIGRANDAVIRGDIAGARRAFGLLATIEEPLGRPLATEPFMSVIRDTPTRTSRIRALTDASTETVRLLLQCGGCHGANRVTPNPGPRPLATGAGLSRHMADYMRGIDGLFRGLVIPSNSEWRQGAARLATVDIPGENWPDNPLLAERRDAASRRIRYWAERALSTSSPYGRANIYASIIEICGSCHAFYPNIWGPKETARREALNLGQ